MTNLYSASNDVILWGRLNAKIYNLLQTFAYRCKYI